MKPNSITINSNFMDKKSEVHILPCKIYFNGETDVKSFFSSSITKSTAVKKEQEKCEIEGSKILFVLNSIE